MANPKHVSLVLQREDWNRWRKKSPNLIPDLSEADLRGADLRGADLSGADLSGADLRGADLRGADFIGADLREANLRRAYLRGANLRAADLREANLREARLQETNLSGANLTVVNLRGADLRGANLNRAELWETIFSNTNLTDAEGLAECIFHGPCTLDHRAIQNSGGLPLPFLRGCGLPDTLIEYLPSLLNRAIQFFSYFISYSTKDRGFAERLYADLQAKGVRCWFAPEDLKIGDKFRARIDESIRVHDKLMLVLSQDSILSAWVETEVETAFERERRENRLVLFPIRLDDAVTDTSAAWAADIRRTRHIGDFSEWKNHDAYAKAFERLLHDLKAGSAKPGR